MCSHYSTRHWYDLDWLLSMTVAIYSPAIVLWTLFIIMRQAELCFNHTACSVATPQSFIAYERLHYRLVEVLFRMTGDIESVSDRLNK